MQRERPTIGVLPKVIERRRGTSFTDQAMWHVDGGESTEGSGETDAVQVRVPLTEFRDWQESVPTADSDTTQ